MQDKNLKIVFMGTPGFAVESLKALLDAGKNIVGVITAPDKPSGRGKKMQSSPVKQFAERYHLRLLQPYNLKDPGFLSELKALKPDLNVVVAFRMLPEVVWSLPESGTINLHASLLPQYRGAAPINWAIINGEKQTGVTTFFINHQIDTGSILFQEKVDIGSSETAGELHDRLMTIGANLVVKTVNSIAEGSIQPVPQDSLLTGEKIRQAPKIFKENCRINWSDSVDNIYNFIRGLSPYPAGWTEFVSAENKYQIKIFKAEKVVLRHSVAFGSIETDGKKILRIASAGGYIDVLNLQLAGKRQLGIIEFLRGFAETEKYRAI
ncbi:MAG: methionyl-tRNA formyltransferase [Bacteroidales bacterium]|nr:methionyl-tRNA formyltransferase [Bacteroidales bacterium]